MCFHDKSVHDVGMHSMGVQSMGVAANGVTKQCSSSAKKIHINLSTFNYICPHFFLLYIVESFYAD
jgi:hypothetical protein